MAFQLISPSDRSALASGGQRRAINGTWHTSRNSTFGKTVPKAGMQHRSDCAVHNAPAYPAGACDYDGLELSSDSAHPLVTRLVSGSGSLRSLIKDYSSTGIIGDH